jgi:chromosome segregation ATPase
MKQLFFFTIALMISAACQNSEPKPSPITTDYNNQADAVTDSITKINNTTDALVQAIEESPEPLKNFPFVAGLKNSAIALQTEVDEANNAYQNALENWNAWRKTATNTQSEEAQQKLNSLEEEIKLAQGKLDRCVIAANGFTKTFNEFKILYEKSPEQFAQRSSNTKENKNGQRQMLEVNPEGTGFIRPQKQ